MNNMNQRSGNCSPSCNTNAGTNMNDRQCRSNGNSNTFGRKNPSMPTMPPASCGCNTCNCYDNASSIQNDPLRGMPLGIGYVPWQQWECVYNVDEDCQRAPSSLHLIYRSMAAFPAATTAAKEVDKA